MRFHSTALSKLSASSLSETAVGTLDDYELAARNGDRTHAEYLQSYTGVLCAALVAAARAMKGRSDMLRIALTLRGVLWGARRHVIRAAIIGIAQADADSSEPTDVDGESWPEFVQPLLKMAVERVSDATLSASVADSLAALLGSVELDSDGVVDERTREVANDQTMRLVGSLITEVSLTSSPRALASLGTLLRRDFARSAFCGRDGVSTLASTLLTDPSDAHPSIGKAVTGADAASMDHRIGGVGYLGSCGGIGGGLGEIATDAGVVSGDASATAVSATYHAALAVWMMSFAASPACVRDVLFACLSARLVLVLSKLLDHVSGRRLKIARVVLATLRNLSTGSTDLHVRIRREMIGADIPAVIQRLGNLGTVIGRDVDATEDARFLIEILANDQMEMSTLDMYLNEVRSGALRWSIIHSDDAFWVENAERVVTESRDVLPLLAGMIAENGTDTAVSNELRAIACNDMARIVRLSISGRRAAMTHPGLKERLMYLMTTADDPELRRLSLNCVQLLLITNSSHR
jgi:hypothetical protein